MLILVSGASYLIFVFFAKLLKEHEKWNYITNNSVFSIHFIYYKVK